jgi:hypothetical protein
MENKSTPDAEIVNFPEFVLFDLARNESATKEWRRAAFILLLERKSKKAYYPELRELRFEIEAEQRAKQEVESLVESAVNDHRPEPDSGGPFRTSVTTKTMYQDEEPPQKEDA